MADFPTAANPLAVDEASLIRRIALVAAGGVALGFAMQLFVLGARTLAGGAPGATFAAELAGGVAWASVVCAGAAIGVSLTRANAVVSGLIAGLFAPLAVAVSKAANQIVAAAVGAADKPAALPLIGLAATKAVEYGLLGFLLATLARRGITRLAPYLGTGAAVGVTFGAAALTIRYASGAGAVELAGVAVNEALFPIGCAAVVYVGAIAARAARVASVTASTG